MTSLNGVYTKCDWCYKEPCIGCKNIGKEQLFQAIVKWMKENPERPARLAFTDSPERQIAYIIEEVSS